MSNLKKSLLASPAFSISPNPPSETFYGVLYGAAAVLAGTSLSAQLGPRWSTSTPLVTRGGIDQPAVNDLNFWI